jgi:hypothetical protein
MKKLLCCLLLAAPLFGQAPKPSVQTYVAGRFVAYNYSLWRVQIYSLSAATGSVTMVLSNGSVTLPDGRVIVPFATTAPLKIGTETATPSAISNCFINNPPNTCTVTVTLSGSHTISETVASGTYGLQEGLNDAGAVPGGTVTLDGSWAAVGGTTAMVNAATVPSNVKIEDCRTGCSAAGAGGVSQIVAGTNVTISPSGGTGTVTINSTAGGGGTTVYTCTGSGDATGLNTALASAGHVVVAGANCAVTSTLTIPSGTWLDIPPATTITCNPSTAIPCLSNTQNAQTIARTCTDVQMTVNSVNITSATCNFSQADVETESIACIGGYAGGLAYGAVAMGTDLHTTFANVTNSTTAALADPPTAVSNPMTCNIYTRDHDIRVTGGTWIMQGPNQPNNPPVLKFITVNRLIVDEAITVARSLTVPSNAGGYSGIYLLDSSNVRILNHTINSWSQGEDGIHMTGPLRSISLSHIKGHSGDDFIAISAADGNSASNGTVDGRVYGVVYGVSVSDVDGSSYANDAGVKLFGPSGTPILIGNVTINHVNGNSQTCPLTACNSSGNLPGFGNAVYLYSGLMDNIIVNDIGGNIVTSAVYAGGSGTGGHDTHIRSLTASNLWQNAYTYSAANQTHFLLGIDAGAVADNVAVDGLKSDAYNLAQDVFVANTSTVSRLKVSNVQFANMTGGAFEPFDLFGTFDDIIFENIQLSYNTGTGASASRGVISLAGSTSNRLALHHFHVTYQSGSASSGTGLVTLANFQPGNLPSTAGDILFDDVSMVASGSALNQYLLFVAASQTVNTYTIQNSQMYYQHGCILNSGTITTAGSIISVDTSNLTTPANCAATILTIPASGNGTLVATTNVNSDSAGQITCWDGSHNVTNSGCPVVPIALISAAPTSDMLCAEAADTSIANDTITGATQANPVVFTVSTNPQTTGYLVGETYGVQNVTPTDYNGTYTITATNTTTITATCISGCVKPPGSAYTSGGTTYKICTNQSSDAVSTSNQPFATSIGLPALASPPYQFNVEAEYGLYTPSGAAASSGYPSLRYGGNTLIGSTGTTTQVVSQTNIPGTTGWAFINPVSGLIYSGYKWNTISASASGAFSSAKATVYTTTTGAANLTLNFGFLATGVATATYTSGGSITGSATQTCTATFAGGSGGSYTIALTGTNTIAGGTAFTVITRDGGHASAPTTATLGSGTATCSGSATVSSTLGGQPGNALALRWFSAKQQ